MQIWAIDNETLIGLEDKKAKSKVLNYLYRAYMRIQFPNGLRQTLMTIPFALLEIFLVFAYSLPLVLINVYLFSAFAILILIFSALFRSLITIPMIVVWFLFLAPSLALYKIGDKTGQKSLFRIGKYLVLVCVNIVTFIIILTK